MSRDSAAKLIGNAGASPAPATAAAPRATGTDGIATSAVTANVADPRPVTRSVRSLATVNSSGVRSLPAVSAPQKIVGAIVQGASADSRWTYSAIQPPTAASLPE